MVLGVRPAAKSSSTLPAFDKFMDGEFETSNPFVNWNLGILIFEMQCF
jgi:hypothetical protein